MQAGGKHYQDLRDKKMTANSSAQVLKLLTNENACLFQFCLNNCERTPIIIVLRMTKGRHFQSQSFSIYCERRNDYLKELEYN